MKRGTREPQRQNPRGVANPINPINPINASPPSARADRAHGFLGGEVEQRGKRRKIKERGETKNKRAKWNKKGKVSVFDLLCCVLGRADKKKM
jgi:hypothetical protein